MGRAATALFLRSYGRGERVPPGDARARLHGHHARAHAAALPPRRRGVRRRHRGPARRRALAVGERGELRDPARGLTYAIPTARSRSRRRPARRARRARRRAGSQRRRQDDADAAPRRPAARGAASWRSRSARWARHAARGAPRVGLVFQDPDDQLFMPTVREDVVFGPLNLGPAAGGARSGRGGARGGRGWTHAADRAPHQLSMGERRRVAIATVLAMRPGLLVLDEPSANLDPARAASCSRSSSESTTMLVVTHDLPFAAELCERAVILAGGRVVADGQRTRCSPTPSCSPRHDLELPAGFDLARIERRPRPGAVSVSPRAASRHTPWIGKWSKRATKPESSCTRSRTSSSSPGSSEVTRPQGSQTRYSRSGPARARRRRRRERRGRASRRRDPEGARGCGRPSSHPA